MRFRRVASIVLLFALLAGAAVADTKIVKKLHQDGFAVMGREQPATDIDQVIWMSEDKMRLEQGESRSIVRLDLGKMYLLNPDRSTYYEFDLPVDLASILPEGVGKHVLDQLRLEVEIQKGQDVRQIGSWVTRRFDLEISSSMMNKEAVLWVAENAGVDNSRFRKMYSQMLRAQPGMSGLAEKMATIDGIVIEQEGTMTMPMLGETKVRSTESTVSIEDREPPLGLYEIPEGWQREELDFSQLMQGQ